MVTINNEITRIFDRLKNKVDIFDIGKFLTQEIIEIFQAEGCELSVLDESNYFERIFFSIKNKDGLCVDQLEVEKLFGEEHTKFEGSLNGNILKGGKPFYWCESKGEDFQQMIEKYKKEHTINENAAKHYFDTIPSGSIKNYAIIPLTKSKDKNDNQGVEISCCLNIYNLHESSIDKNVIENSLLKLWQIIEFLGMFIFQAIYYKKANDEIEINKIINNIIKDSESLDGALKKIVDHFGKKLNSPLNTIWFVDKNHDLLILHSVHLNLELCKNNLLNEQALRKYIYDNLPKVMKVKESYIGKLINDNEPYLQCSDLSKLERYNWNELVSKIGTKKIFCVPIKDSEDDKVIIALVFHPEMNEHVFDRINFKFFVSFANQISIAINYFIEKYFTSKARILPSKLSERIDKKGEITNIDLAYKIKEIIGAEACSIFEAKGSGESDAGIYLRATTDNTKEAKDKIGRKIYDLNLESITSYCASIGESIIVYDINKVQDIYPEITKPARTFVEKTERPHTSCILVPIPEGVNLNSEKYEPVLIVRCINKESSQDEYTTALFTENDRHLLNFLGLVYQSYKKVFEILKERRDLINLVVHETRNPITSIRSKLDVIFDKQKKIKSDISIEKLEQKLIDIEFFVQLLKNLVGNLDLLNRLMQGKEIHTKPRSVKIVTEIIENVIYWMKPQFYDNKLDPQIVEYINLDKKLNIIIDKEHMIYVFYNLISNCIKYRKIYGTQKIQISFEYYEKGIGIKVSDWGMGLEGENINKLFERGIRGKYAQKHKIRGRGFGLWLCKELLIFNRLDIKVVHRSNPTSFEIFIPNKIINN